MNPRRAIPINQPNHILILIRHDFRRHAHRLPYHIPKLAHGNGLLLLPLQHRFKIFALPHDAEIGIRLITNIYPVMDEWICICIAHQLLQQGIYAM